MANPFANTIKFLTAVNLLASPSGATIKKLMERLNISRRTAFRLLEALTELGYPLADEQSGRGIEKTYRLIDSYVLKLPNMAMPNPGLTGEEIEAMLTILDYCDTMRQIGKTPILASIKQKIRALNEPGTKSQPPEGSCHAEKETH
jgi:predicted DNA-binding transcriptional regulator YafY